MIKAYFRILIDYKQNGQVRLLLMTEFTYNNAKNANTGHTPFELNCDYHFYISYKQEINPCSKSKLVDKLSIKL